MTQWTDHHEVLDYLSKLDMRSVEKRLKRQGWSVNQIQKMIQYYRMYLCLRWQHPNMEPPPSQGIARVWQAHLLDTRAYEQMCRDLFGSLLAYTPPDKASNRFETITQPAFHELFGYSIPSITQLNWFEYVRQLASQNIKKVSFSVIFLALLLLGFHYMEYQNIQTNNQYQRMIRSVRHLFFLEEEIANLCQRLKQGGKYQEFYLTSLRGARQQLKKYFFQASTIQLDLRRQNLLTSKANHQLTELNHRMNRLYFASFQVCDHDFKQGHDLKQQRIALIQLLNQSRRKHLWLAEWLDDPQVIQNVIEVTTD